jgi:hypothetical protein
MVYHFESLNKIHNDWCTLEHQLVFLLNSNCACKDSRVDLSVFKGNLHGLQYPTSISHPAGLWVRPHSLSCLLAFTCTRRPSLERAGSDRAQVVEGRAPVIVHFIERLEMIHHWEYKRRIQKEKTSGWGEVGRQKYTATSNNNCICNQWSLNLIYYHRRQLLKFP